VGLLLSLSIGVYALEWSQSFRVNARAATSIQLKQSKTKSRRSVLRTLQKGPRGLFSVGKENDSTDSLEYFRSMARRCPFVLRERSRAAKSAKHRGAKTILRSKPRGVVARNRS